MGCRSTTVKQGQAINGGDQEEHNLHHHDHQHAQYLFLKLIAFASCGANIVPFGANTFAACNRPNTQ